MSSFQQVFEFKCRFMILKKCGMWHAFKVKIKVASNQAYLASDVLFSFFSNLLKRACHSLLYVIGIYLTAKTENENLCETGKAKA